MTKPYALTLFLATLLLASVPALAQESTSEPRIDLSYQSVDRWDAGGVLHLVVDVIVTNRTPQDLFDVEAEAMLLGDLPGNMQLDNISSIAPATLWFGDLGPGESAVYPNVELTLNYLLQEPRLVWNVQYVDAAWNPQATKVGE